MPSWSVPFRLVRTLVHETFPKTGNENEVGNGNGNESEKVNESEHGTLVHETAGANESVSTISNVIASENGRVWYVLERTDVSVEAENANANENEKANEKANEKHDGPLPANARTSEWQG
ncbi:hypothetical protein CPC08DRAFT_729497 [Agrocybe pediades]|nr:hypothetical protein CPC08DRAFT_729497 [Agrocybe pediades]